MEKLTLDLPTMYGDHHVIEVRQLLMGLPGVEDVYASSAFRIVEIAFDASQVTGDTITEALDNAGYLGELDVPVESVEPANGQVKRDEQMFRSTAAVEKAKNVVGFAQQVNYTGRPLWPCPGMGPLSTTTE